MREVLESSAFVGQEIRITGRCLGYGKSVAQGGPPRTRSDWQLEDDGAAIYVTGPLPTGCSATAGSAAPTTITARVAEDTIRALADHSASARRYLVVMSP